MNALNVYTSLPPHPPFGHLLPAGEKGKRNGPAHPFSPRGEGGGSRMRGPFAPHIMTEVSHG
jgi:hypothetical protein